MEHLNYCLNATMPIFALMVLGFFLRKVRVVDDVFAARLNQFVFRVSLPVLVFKDMAQSDFFRVWDGRFVLFCFVVTAVSIFVSVLCSLGMKDRACRGEFVQASYRSSAAILGVALMENLYGNAGAAPLMIIGAVPLYNVAAVSVLTLMRPRRGEEKRDFLRGTLLGVVKNPILIGVVAGCLWSVLKLPQPNILTKAVSNVAATATPLGLIAMGASFDLKKAAGALKPAVVCAIMKLVGFEAVFLPVAAAMGFRAEQLVAILVMLGSATTVSCYVMAKNLDYEGTLTSSTVMITTLFAAFTLTGWLYLVRSMGLI